MSLLGRTEVAAYSTVKLEIYKGNPLIEALPRKLKQIDVLEKLAIYPPLPDETRFTEDETEREEYLVYIELLRQPFEIYYDVFRAIETAIKKGYSAKNPLTPTTQHFLHYPVETPTSVSPSTGKFAGRGRGITIIGESGIGKSTMLEQVLFYFPQVIQHSRYNGEYLGFRDQVVWIKVECPDKSSVRELCEEILRTLDEAIGSELTTPKPKHSGLITQIEQKIKSSHLGLIVIDEMQNLSAQRTRGESGLLKFLKKIVNRLGVPIVFCANPPFDDLLIDLPQNARRSENGGAFYMKPLTRDSIGWKAFIEQLWQLQWTNTETPLTESLERKMYELCLGNVDFACRTFAKAQSLVMGTDDESICEVVLQDAYERECVFSSKTSVVLTARERLLKEVQQSELGFTRKRNTKKEVFIPTIDRIQHHEFYDSLKEVLTSDRLLETIANPDLIRSAAEENSPIEFLRSNSLLCDDPLDEEFL